MSGRSCTKFILDAVYSRISKQVKWVLAMSRNELARSVRCRRCLLGSEYQKRGNNLKPPRNPIYSNPYYVKGFITNLLNNNFHSKILCRVAIRY